MLLRISGLDKSTLVSALEDATQPLESLTSIKYVVPSTKRSESLIKVPIVGSVGSKSSYTEITNPVGLAGGGEITKSPTVLLSVKQNV